MKNLEQEERLAVLSMESSVGQILATIELFPLLTDKEEQEVAHYYCIAKALAAAANSKGTLLALISDEESIACIARGKAARETLIVSNLRLVFKIAKRFKIRYEKKNIPLEDLFQQGVFGLMTAVDKFEPERNLKFSTSAVWWIKDEIRRYLQNGNVIRVPIYQQGLIETHEKETGDHQSLSLRQIARLTEAYNASKTISLDSLTYEDGTPFDLSEFDTSSSFDELFATFDIEDIRDVMEETLTPKEQLVVELYYGFHKNQELTSREIGQRFGFHQGSINAVKAKALGKLSRYLKLQGMKNYRESFEII